MGHVRSFVVVAVVASGCLSAPQKQTEKDDGGGGGDAACAPFLADTFGDGVIQDAVWDIDLSGNGSIAPGDGVVVLSSPADDAGAYAKLELQAPVSLVNTTLAATFSASTEGDGTVYFNLSVTEADELSFYVERGNLHAEYETGGEDDELCDPCPAYTGDVITVRVTATETDATLDWDAGNGASELLGMTPALPPGPVVLQIETYAIGADTATVTLEEISWTDCDT